MSDHYHLAVSLDSDTLLPPLRATPGSAGFDIRASHEGTVLPLGSLLVGTGMRVTLPKGTVGLLKSRSGLAAKHEIEVGAGVIDEDYRGEVKVLLRNHSPSTPFTFARNDRIAQLLVLPVAYPSLHVVWEGGEIEVQGGDSAGGGNVVVGDAADTGIEYEPQAKASRGMGGFGSSGLA
jgi:dUTP pyrophosphatase